MNQYYCNGASVTGTSLIDQGAGPKIDIQTEESDLLRSKLYNHFDTNRAEKADITNLNNNGESKFQGHKDNAFKEKDTSKITAALKKLLLLKNEKTEENSALIEK